MSFTTTPNLSLKKPTTGADNDIWGDHLNQNSDTLDTVVAAKAPLVHTHTASQITDFAEATDDRVAALLVQGANVTLTYNDAANTLTVASTGSTAAATFVGDSPPGSPTAGQLWWESDSGLMFIYYTDANSSAWVPATVGTQGPPGKWTQITQAAYNALSPPDAATLYVIVG